MFGSKLTESDVSGFKTLKRFSAAYKKLVADYFWSRKERPTDKPVPFSVNGMGHTSRHVPGLSETEVGTFTNCNTQTVLMAFHLAYYAFRMCSSWPAPHNHLEILPSTTREGHSSNDWHAFTGNSIFGTANFRCDDLAH